MALTSERLNLGKFLKERREELQETSGQFSQIDVALELGVSQPQISKLERGGVDVTRWPSRQQWALLKAYRYTDKEALAVAEQFALDIPPRQPSIMNLQTDAPQVLGRAVHVYPAGTGPTWDLDEVLETIYLPEGSYPNQSVIGLKAMSDSMDPYLPKYATAIIILDDGLVKPGDFCGIRMADDGVVVKRFVKELPGGLLLLESLNPGPGEDRFFTAPLGSRIMGKVDQRLLKG